MGQDKTGQDRTGQNRTGQHPWDGMAQMVRMVRMGRDGGVVVDGTNVAAGAGHCHWPLPLTGLLLVVVVVRVGTHTKQQKPKGTGTGTGTGTSTGIVTPALQVRGPQGGTSGMGLATGLSPAEPSPTTSSTRTYMYLPISGTRT